MTSQGGPGRSTVLLVGAGLALIIVVGTGLQGAATFSGLRWVPDFTPPSMPPLPHPSGTRDTQATPLPVHPARASGGLDLTPVLWIVGGLALIAAILLVIRWLLRRPARTVEAIVAPELSDAHEHPTPAEPEKASAPTVRRGLSQAIEALNREREPHDAIVKAWLGLQDAAADAGVQRRPAETPTEFTGRILSRVPADRRAVDTLLNRYLKVRFGDHAVTEHDVALVREALTTLAASWEQAENARRASIPDAPWSRTP